ncbi:RICIN domain-containing protein, partial [Candidatus Saccharibacteria bacterium]|nr:RICIN domain-containing protein [Candidatus Saccharibacteria bacterium]
MMSNRRKDRRVWFLALGIFSAVFLFSFLAQRFKGSDESAEAASLENFDPGYIISDYQMGNYNSMSEAEIQAFLTKKNPCSNRDQGYYQRLLANNPGIKWRFSDGHFICLSEELFGDGEVIGSGETAAHIIWQAAQDYKINPQVLIVLLQKESGLITDPIPNNIDYRTATGYGCPDTAPCSSEYFGLKNQIRKAAAMFRTVLDGGWTNYPLGENYIQYNPNSECGGSVVNIRSLATSALYRYTPYQPNAGALAAGYGSAYCGAYGNRNFDHYIEDWFGGVRDEYEIAIEAKTNFENPIVDGEYMIISKQSGKVVDIRGGVNDNMVSAETIMFDKKSDLNDAENQIFYISYNDATGFYNIKNLVSNLYFDVKSGNITNSTPIIMWRKTDGCNQDWLLEQDDDGYYTIVSRCSSKVLDATSSNKFILFEKHNADNQKWKLEPLQSKDNKIANGVYQIRFSDSQGVLDVSGGVSQSMTSGNVVKFAKKELDSETLDNQLFSFVYDVDRRAYNIINPLSGLNLKAGSPVTISASSESCLERWVINKDKRGSKIVSSCDGAQLGVSSIQIGSAKAIST